MDRLSALVLLSLVLGACAPDGVAPRDATDAADPTVGATGEPAVAFLPPPFENPPMTSVPLLGGTLEAAPDIGGAVAADPEGNRLVILAADAAPLEVDLGGNARPFRVHVEGTDAYVTLRGTGDLARIDLLSGAIAWRTPVCPEPRGIDRASATGELVVACAGGELVALDDDGRVLRGALLDPDLRDVVDSGGILYVSRFRAGEVLLVGERDLQVFDVAPLGATARVVWRMRADPDGDGVVALYDDVSTAAIVGSGGYYGRSRCNSRHQTTFGRVGPDGYAVPGANVDGTVLAVDFVIRASRDVVIVNGGATTGALRGDLVSRPLDDLLEAGNCETGTDLDVAGDGQPSAVAEVSGVLVAQTEAGASIADVAAGTILWDAGAPAAADDDPFALLHRDTGTGVACASCHPEGQDDGHVWTFGEGVSGVALAGARRTLPLAGSPSLRAPYHWMGELATSEALLHSTFTLGMGGRELTGDGAALFAWLDGVRPVHAATAASADTLAEGAALFESAGCATCHGGPALTDNRLVSVRGDETFKTPTLLGVGLRTSLMHDGCARTLEDRLTGPESCTGGDRHGTVSGLSDEQIGALVAYLSTL